MDIKFWKKGGNYILVKDIWHIESCLWAITFYTHSDIEYRLRLLQKEDGTYDIHSAILAEVKCERDYEHEDWIQTILSKTEIQGWIAVPKNECYEKALL